MSIAEIKNISIIELAKKIGIDVKRKKAMCYNGHDTKTPSLSFNDKKGVFKCFGCGDGGDQITLVEKALKMSFKESCQWIEHEFSIINYEHKNQNYPKKRRLKSFRIEKEIIENPFSSDPDVYEWLMQELTLSEKGENYLISRGFSKELIHRIGIKDLTNPYDIFNKIINKWGSEKCLKCGLLKLGDTSKLKFVWWDYTIIFPFTDANLRINYLQGRRLSDRGAKYVNLKGVEPSLFNLECLNHMESFDKLLICEGITDSLSAIMMGKNAVGVLGANGFKEKWVKDLMNYEIIVVPDSDSGGDKFANSVMSHFATFGKPIQRLQLPEGKDLNDILIESNE